MSALQELLNNAFDFLKRSSESTPSRNFKEEILHHCRQLNVTPDFRQNMSWERSYLDIIQNIFGKVLSLYLVAPEPNSEEEYAACLHELGHATFQKFWHKRHIAEYCLADEMIAWRWARKNASIWTKRMQKTFETGINTYIDGHFSGERANKIRLHIMNKHNIKV